MRPAIGRVLSVPLIEKFFMDLFELTNKLMSIPSVSGDEEAVGVWLRDHLRSLGWTVELQPVSENQSNIIAYLNDTPLLAFDPHGHGAAFHCSDRG